MAFYGFLKIGHNIDYLKPTLGVVGCVPWVSTCTHSSNLWHI